MCKIWFFDFSSSLVFDFSSPGVFKLVINMGDYLAIGSYSHFYTLIFYIFILIFIIIKFKLILIIFIISLF